MATDINMSALTREQLMRVLENKRQWQGYYDPVFEPWGVSTPQPTINETPREYRDRLAITAKRLFPEDHQLRKLQYRRMDDSIINGFEPQLLKAVKAAAYDPTTVPYDAPLRQVKERDQSGREHIRFIGQRSFIHDFTRPGRRVVSFAQPTDNRGRSFNQFGHAQPLARLVIHNGLPVGTTGRGEF